MKKQMQAALGFLCVAMLVGCGSDGGGSVTGPSNSTPSGSGNAAPTASIAVSSSTALMSIQSVAFTATASDSNGDALTYAWDLGDGTTASGPSVQKVYDKAGTLHVVLKVTDSKGASTSVSTEVVVKSLSGFWKDSDQGYGIEIIQDGTKFTGRTVFGIQNLTGALTGTINTGLQVQYRTSYFSGAFKDSLDGKLDASLDVITGTLALTDGRVRFTFNMNMTRQK